MATVANYRMTPDEAYLREAVKSGRAKLTQLSMKALGKPDTRLQCRVQHLDVEHVRRLDLIDEETGSIAPIVVFEPSDGTYLIADGFHRHRMKEIKRAEWIAAYVMKGTRLDALEFFNLCNRQLCLPRTREDIRKAINLLLSEDHWFWKSDGAIATHIGCAVATVTKRRTEWCKEKGIPFPRTYEDIVGKKKPRKQGPVGIKTTVIPGKGILFVRRKNVKPDEVEKLLNSPKITTAMTDTRYSYPVEQPQSIFTELPLYKPFLERHGLKAEHLVVTSDNGLDFRVMKYGPVVAEGIAVRDQAKDVPRSLFVLSWPRVDQRFDYGSFREALGSLLILDSCAGERFRQLILLTDEKSPCPGDPIVLRLMSRWNVTVCTLDELVDTIKGEKEPRRMMTEEKIAEKVARDRRWFKHPVP